MAKVHFIILSLVVIIFLGGLGGFGYQYSKERDERIALQQRIAQLQQKGGSIPVPVPVPVAQQGASDFVPFQSEGEFAEYLLEAEASSGFGGTTLMRTMAPQMEATFPADCPNCGLVGGAPVSGVAMDSAMPQRISETNVQVAGVDEPDILKTDGKEIYFSPRRNYAYAMPFLEEVSPSGSGIHRVFPKTETMVFKAFPPDALAKEGAIDKSGDLFLIHDTLVVLAGNIVYGYDVTNPKAPTEKWSVKLDAKNQFVQARLYEEKVYLVTRTGADRYRPCPFPLFGEGESAIVVPCTEVYHPVAPVPVDGVYTISTINPSNGEVKKGISFVGSYDSVVYMSRNALYVAYAYEGDVVRILYDFFKENGDLVPAQVTDRLGKLLTYDISPSAKMMEFGMIMEEFTRSLGRDDELKLSNELQNRADAYFTKRMREFVKTDVVKIGITSFAKEAVGAIPGRLLNQFALDEFEGNLRAATTVGQGFSGGFGGNSGKSENDVYVLDGSLSIVGSVKGLGLGERIYSVRFVGNKGYVVTFRQTDPFYVLDFSDPYNPAMKGELKIPGFSSYLHPITPERILGVGQENGQVKISLFDVSSAENPKEAAKYMLSDYWSEVSSTHHAFLLDDKHKIFFLPGGKGGYVFSYENDKLQLKKAVSGIAARRALFLDDYLYIAGDNTIVVLDEKNWEKVKELDLVR